MPRSSTTRDDRIDLRASREEKRILAAAAAYLAGFRRVLVLAPPHLVKKWQREVLQTVPGAKVAIVRTISDLERVRRFLEPLLRRRYDQPEPRLHDLEQLEQLAAGFTSRERFVTDLTLDPPVSTSDLAGPPHRDEDYVVLSTIHSAKGGEWDVVHVIHAADGMIPSDMATGDPEQLEEERRLFYVALTRARDELLVTFPLRYHRANRGREDRHWYAQLTRFLPAEVRTRFALRSTFTEPTGESAAVAPAAAVSTVDAALAGLWSD